ncbi:hypothetical protein XI09_07125 [Bradyrhizobium sp. CCBAU 11386]|uniref:hypothetical protein n=1 Tax=Bradyrhizobium sp. CCBAU 11386 TaxID=1630837 RepID=UPI0023020892|nr:hypothetical protein [Bradyrhizobium sp. CCBAU 11386]MDA9504521.1 hypothetical protein [Bradyrhizobium sp. CCBAU 11386]
MVFKLDDCATATAAAVCLARMARSFGESQVARCGPDLVSGRASVCEEAAKGLAKAMRPSIER